MHPKLPAKSLSGSIKHLSKSLMRGVAVNAPFQNVRVAMYRKAGVSIAKPLLFGGHVWIDFWDKVTIDEGVLLAGYNFILTHSWFGNLKIEPVRIKRGAKIGVRAIILPGITVGENALVGAGSVVTHDVPDDAVVAGSPARFLGWAK